MIEDLILSFLHSYQEGFTQPRLPDLLKAILPVGQESRSCLWAGRDQYQNDHSLEW